MGWLQKYNALVLVLGSELLALLLVHVYGDGKAFPESGIADAGHFVVIVGGGGSVVLFVFVVLVQLGCTPGTDCDTGEVMWLT